MLPTDAAKEIIELTEKAVRAFAKHEFDDATRHLDDLEEQFGPSGLVNVYRNAMANAGEVFDGVLHLQMK